MPIYKTDAKLRDNQNTNPPYLLLLLFTLLIIRFVICIPSHSLRGA